MKPTDFSYYLSRFLTIHLPDELGASKNTISSYRDAFVLLLIYLRDVELTPVERVSLKDITRSRIESFLNWIETERKCSAQTRNVRLAAIHSFFRYLQYEDIDHLIEWQRILSIPVKKNQKGHINYMSIEGIKLLLEMPDRNSKFGRRDLALLSLMYDTAARVQEIADLTPRMICLESPATIKLIGKGQKARIVPLMNPQVKILKAYMDEWNLIEPFADKYPLFFNKKREKLTRAGIGYILDKYIQMARKIDPLIVPDKFTCHCLRHSKSMHLLQAGVNLVYIRDILGHKSIQTTEVYARADSKQKRKAIEDAYSDVVPKEEGKWHNSEDLLDWLKNFQKI